MLHISLRGALRRARSFALLSLLGAALLALGCLAQTAQADNAVYSGEVLADTPLGFWPLSGTSTTSMTDATGHGYTLTGAGAMTPDVAGPMPNTTGVEFNGGYFTRPYFNYNNNFAMEMWARSNRVNERQAIVSNGWVGSDNCWHASVAGAHEAYAMGHDANTCSSGGWTGWPSVFASTTDWHHIVLQRVSGVTSLWIDGVQQDGNGTNAITLNGGAFRIGGFNDSKKSNGIGIPSESFGPFKGAISNVAYYNHTLTAQRIAAHYNAAVGAPSNTTPPSISPSTLLGPGLTLTADPGQWTGAGITYDRQWLRCASDGTACDEISGATSSTYVLQAGDAGHAIRVRVTATDSAGNGVATSAATDPIATQTPHGQSLYAQAVMDDTPLGFWPLNGASTTSAADATGHGYTLTGAGSITVGTPGPMTGSLAVTFDGGYLTRPYFNHNNNFAMEVWARSNRVSERQAIVSNGWVGSDNCWHAAVLAGQFSGLLGFDANTCYSVGSSGGYDAFASTTDWHHIVLQRVSGTTSLYVDGVQRGYTGTNAITLNGGAFRIGGFNDSKKSNGIGTPSESFGPFKGAVSNVAFYNHTLTGPQIAAHHNAAVGIPTNTTLPTINPTAALHESDTVTADPGTWAGAGTISYAYQWQACPSPSSCSAIGGATAATYQLTAAEVGKTVKVVVTATNALGSGSATSAATAEIVGGEPSNTVAPSISGETEDGEELTSTTGTWSGDEPISYTRQWLRCDTDGEDCSPVAGETGETYILTAADVGATLRVSVTASNAIASVTARSTETDVVAGRQPDNKVLPSIDGAAAEGSQLTATSGTWEGTEPVSYAYRWRRCAGSGGSCVDIAGATSGTYTLTTADVGAAIRVVVTATNVAGEQSATSAATDPVAGAIEAPQLPVNETTDVGDASEFLYAGENPIQEGVEPETIVGERAAVVRGRVLDTDGVPLAGVTATVVDHPELGSMTTTGDGQVYLAVNGGGTLRVRYERDGYLPVERDVDVPWQNWAWADDVRLTELDGQVTDVDLSTPLSVAQIARGSVETDDSGSRQATLLFPAGTTASMTLDGGVEMPLSHLNVRATEYTVGDHGEDAMPASLPAASAYTYAVDYTVDEAVTAGASRVSFSQPVITYTDDFLGFEAGTSVPVGYYDKDKGAWVPAPDGRVIEILSETGGAADIDADGDGDPDSAPELALLDITEDERTTLADLYAPGKRLWRVPVTHFTPYDYNWGSGIGGGAWRVPGVRGSGFGPMDGSCSSGGSIIGCDDQTLGEDLALAGTGASLHYRSDRTPGRVVGNTLQMTVTPASTGALIRAQVTIDVAGQQIKRQFDADPSQAYSYTWDGKDAFGREITGAVDANVRVDYVYPTFYRVRTPEAGGPIFGQPGGSITTIPTRDEGTTTGMFSVKIGGLKKAPGDLGGWTLSGHNSYDPAGKILHLGDGEQVSAQELGTPIAHFAGDGGGVASRGGGGGGGSYGDGGPAEAADIRNLGAGAVGPDGSVYLVDGGHHRVRRVGPDGIIETVAGGGEEPEEGPWTDAGDGGPATDAWLAHPSSVALGIDGSLYIADGYRVRKVAPDGTIDAFAGTGADGAPSGDGGPATSAVLSAWDGIAVATDGTLYVADGEHDVVRRIGPDGTISSFAGTGVAGFSGDQGPATAAKLNSPQGLAVAPDGSLHIADTGNYRVRRVTPDGVIDTVAGNGVNASSGDGLTATSASLASPYWLATATDGTLYVTESSKVRAIRPDGKISTFAGGGSGNAMGGGAASAANLGCPRAVMTAPDGSVYINDSCAAMTFHVGSVLPGAGQESYQIPAPDGSLVYTFDRHGRHLKTANARTGADTATMAYDSSGRLLSITDGDGNVTTVERAPAGYPTAIVAPFGQRTELTRDSNGWLASVEDPGGHAFTMTSTSRGLLRSLTSPKGNTSTFEYDAVGYLTSDSDAAGGSKELVRTNHEGGANVVMTTAGGKATTYGTTRDGVFDSTTRSFTAPSGLVGGTVKDGNGILERTLPDGSTLTNKRAPDPRFGLGAPLISGSVTTPGGVEFAATSSKSVELSDPDDLMSLESSDDEAEINGRTWLSHFDGSSLEETATSPEGRSASATSDAQGRAVTTTIPGLLPIQRDYDSHGRLSEVVQGSRTTTYDYGADGLLAEVVAPLNQVTTFTRDANGRVVDQTFPGGRTVHYTHDDNGNVTSITPPGRSGYVFSHTEIDQPETGTAPNVGDGATATRFHYNDDRQVTALDRPDGTSLVYDYDNGGRLTSLASGGDEITYDYNSNGQVASIEAPSGQDLSFGYDGGLFTRQTLSGVIAGEVTESIDDDLRTASVTVSGSDPVGYTYDQDGLLTGVGELSIDRTASNGFVSGTGVDTVTTTTGWTPYGELASAEAKVSGQTVLAGDYDRDALGRIEAKDETDANGTTVHHGYDYDASGRLSEVTENGNAVASYVYDANGNRTSVTTTGGTRTATYDAQDRLVSDGSTDYTYNKNGQLVEKSDGPDETAYEYDAFGTLAGVDLPDGRRVDYVLDGQERRVGKKVDGLLVDRFIYGKGLNPQAELDAAGDVRSLFVYGADAATPSLMIRGGNTYRFVTDERSSPRLVIDADTGAVVQRLSYDAFGTITADSNPGFQPFGFGGGIYDRDTGLTRFGQRDYDARTGRFTTKDPLGFGGGDANLYVFGLGDPVNNADPTGASLFEDGFPSPGDLAGDAIGAVSGLGNTAAAAFNAAPNFAAGALDGLTSGLSTQIAGHVFGFNPSCADFGTAGRIGQGFGTLASMFNGQGVAAFAGRSAFRGEVGFAGRVPDAASHGKTGFIGFENGPPAIVPDGAIGPHPPKRGTGVAYTGGSGGGHGLDSRVTGVRVMDGSANHKPRTVYMNKEDQSVNPLTGNTVSREHPSAHLQ